MKFEAKLPSGTSEKSTVKLTGTGATGVGVSVGTSSAPWRSPGRRPAESNAIVTGSEPPVATDPDAGVSESQEMESTHQPVSPESNAKTVWDDGSRTQSRSAQSAARPAPPDGSAGTPSFRTRKPPRIP